MSAPAQASVTCPSCGEPGGQRDAFCESCGARLDPVTVSDGQRASAGSCPDCPGAPVTADGYCESCGRKVPAGRDHEELSLGVLAGATDRGRRHHRNEDALALATASGPGGPVAIAVVCDGVSSSARPDDASLAAATAAAGELAAASRAGADAEEASRRGVAAAMKAVSGLAGSEAGGAPAATFVSAIADQSGATICWLGDSRAYWLEDGPGSRRLTTDDSVVAQLAAAGLVADADAPDAPGAHVVTAWLGADSDAPEPHLLRFIPERPGALLLCSDGLWNYRPEASGLAALALPGALAPDGLMAAAAGLVSFAVDAGGMDNVTAVLIPYPAVPQPAGRGTASSEPETRPAWPRPAQTADPA